MILEDVRQQQLEIAQRVRICDDFGEIRILCGLDVSCNFFHRDAPLHAAAVLLEFPSMKILEEAAVTLNPTFPYRTGFLAFREAPIMMAALNKLSQKPDLLVVDGQGIAHPRGCGIASHLGVLVDIPSIGVAKTRLFGNPKNLGADLTPLVHHQKTFGMVWRSKKRARPIIISPGHRVSIPTALALIQKMVIKHRLPEPIRLAHQCCNRQRILQSVPSQ